MWNDLGRHYDFSLLCAYVMGNFYKESDGEEFAQVCHVHTRSMPTEAYSALEDSDSRLVEVARLQQRARALEAEIQHRKQVEEQLSRVVYEQTSRGAQNEERFRLIIESVRDYAIFMLDAERPRVDVERGRASASRGIAPTRSSASTSRRFYPKEDVAAASASTSCAIAARDGRFEDEGWRLRKDGSRFWANVIISRITRDKRRARSASPR